MKFKKLRQEQIKKSIMWLKTKMEKMQIAAIYFKVTSS